MDIVETIKEIQEETPYFPAVALYMQIQSKFRRENIGKLLNEAVKERKLIWGRTPFTYWFATELSDLDRERIAESSWTIEQDFV